MKSKYCKLRGSNKIYLIENIIGSKVTIRHTNMTIVTDISNVIILDETNISDKSSKSNITISVSNKIVPNEIMLRHKLKEEAIYELDKYIDSAIVAKLGRVRIIHGKHGGVLRKAVHEYLNTHPLVKEYHIADYSEGGLGVTVAILGKKQEF